MGELLWKIGSEEKLREFIISQDRKFQSAMRAALGMPKEPKVIRRQLPAPQVSTPQVAPPRDVIDLVSNAALLRQPIAWKRIVDEVCIKHQVTRAEILGPQRAVRIVAARHEAMYRMKTETTMSLPAIGKRIGGRDHTTVLHGVRRYEAALRGEVYRQPDRRRAKEGT